MAHPDHLVGEAAHPGRLQTGDDGAGETTSAHVGQGRVIDQVVIVAGPEQFQEVPPALGRAGGKPGEMVVADLRAHAVARLMAGAGVVHAGRALSGVPAPL